MPIHRLQRIDQLCELGMQAHALGIAQPAFGDLPCNVERSLKRRRDRPTQPNRSSRGHDDAKADRTWHGPSQRFERRVAALRQLPRLHGAQRNAAADCVRKAANTFATRSASRRSSAVATFTG